MAQSTGKPRPTTRRQPARTPQRAGTSPPGAGGRLRLGLGIMLVLLLVVGGKLFMVQGLDVGGVAAEALENRLRPAVLLAERGSILDAKGTVLANSVIRYDVSIDQVINTETEEFHRLTDAGDLVKVTRDQGLSELAALLGTKVEDVREASTGDRKYSLLARDVEPDIEDRISKLQIPGLVTTGTSKRVYPNGSVAGGIVGFLVDGTTGQAGIEQTQDELLRGTNGERLYEIGADGLRIPVGIDELTPAVDGKDVKLTLDADLQYFAQQAIQTQKEALGAEWASLVVSEIKTGNVIAMADTNTPDPNNPGGVDAKDRGVRSVTAAYEPGSVEKMMTLAALIEEGKATPLSEYDLPSWEMNFNGQTIGDSFEHGPERRTLAGILGYSMNTGTVTAGKALTKEQRYNWLKKFGIGEAPDVGLPSEAAGILAPWEQWDERQELTVMFGQGVSQSTLQTVRAYQSIGNNGVMLQPRLIDSYISPDGTEEKVEPKPPQQVVSAGTAQQVRDMLESAVTEGRIKDAAIDGYRVGAKTGTAESPCDNGAGFCGFTSSLVGMAPMDDPQFIVEVVVQRPQPKLTTFSLGPTFRSVMGQVLRTHNVQPSKGEPVRLPQFAE
ncbi:peptidoglycan D,D-transpeptidase FtsI family protein [Pseudarthrobacter sp. J64]|uniref:peptidoglycan D,D-transpeptidase FtsI family protein n=1 Tax=Pseudarthrobacter sp. J64 TaxID=3116485 RepID=UPI003FA6F786